MFDKKIDNTSNSYGDDAIVTLSPREHIRLRPGMYVGVVGDGSQPDEALYVLIKEVVDNSIDEFIMGAGRQIDITTQMERIFCILPPFGSIQCFLRFTGCAKKQRYGRNVQYFSEFRCTFLPLIKTISGVSLR